jgi:hypothetical protein
MLLFSLEMRRALCIMSRPNLLHLELNVEPSSLTGPCASLYFSIGSRMCLTIGHNQRSSVMAAYVQE